MAVIDHMQTHSANPGLAEDREPLSAATFLGWLAAALGVLAVLFALLVLSQAVFSNGTTGESHVDQAGSSNPGALPAPQIGNSTLVNPKAAPGPAPADMPVKTGNSPAAAARQQ